jgi:hypothetical protein
VIDGNASDADGNADADGMLLMLMLALMLMLMQTLSGDGCDWELLAHLSGFVTASFVTVSPHLSFASSTHSVCKSMSSKVQECV